MSEPNQTGEADPTTEGERGRESEQANLNGLYWPPSHGRSNDGQSTSGFTLRHPISVGFWESMMVWVYILKKSWIGNISSTKSGRYDKYGSRKGQCGAITGPLFRPSLSISGQYEVERNIGEGGRGERGEGHFNGSA